VSIAHLGDLGHQLTAAQLAAIGKVDVALVPVGGVYTVDAAGAKAVCDAIGAKWVIPMHYRHAPYGLPNIGGVEDFLALWPTEQVYRLAGPNFELPTAPAGVLVPTFTH
jgi:L-ascorbate metabolism protein UlaG (beta-lactamase superfamily)